MKKSLSLFAALLAFAAAQAQETTAEKFELQHGIIFVKVKINGQGPFQFIFDTGANTTVLRPDTAKQLGLKESGGIFSMGLTSLDEIAVGEAKVKGMKAAVMTAPQAELPLKMLGIKYDGILGYNFISRFVIQIDYKKKELKLTPSDYEPENLEDLMSMFGKKKDKEETTPAVQKEVQSEKKTFVGIAYRTIRDDEANEIGLQGGVSVVKVSGDSPAEEAGFKEGDVIVEIGGSPVETAHDYEVAVKKNAGKSDVKVKVVRSKKDVALKLNLK